MLVEICANSYQSVINAEKAGAHRIELCSELAVGGITPSFGLLKKVIQNISIPVHVLIRPRSGDFNYSDEEFEIMKEDIRLCKDLGCAGIVSGVLHTDNSIDIKRTQELVNISRPMSFTFHRAFDIVINPKNAIQQLIDIKVDRVLTSGQKENAENGIDMLIELQNIAKDNIIIMPGSGINTQNSILFKNVGFKEIHTSASIAISSDNASYFGNTQQTVSDVSTIKRILKIVKDEE